MKRAKPALKIEGDEWCLRLAKGKLKCALHLFTAPTLSHRRPFRTYLVLLDSLDNDDSCSVLWRGQLLVGSFFAVGKADTVEGFPLQVLFSSPGQVCPGDWLPKYLCHLHLLDMSVERGDLSIGEHTLLELSLCMRAKTLFLNQRSNHVARAWYQAGAPIQIPEECTARCARQRERLHIRTLKENICRKHYVNISSWYEIYSLWQCLCHSLFVLEHLLKIKLTGKNFYRSGKGQATIASLESQSCIYDGWGLMLKRAQASGMWLMQYHVTSFSNGKRSHFRV